MEKQLLNQVKRVVSFYNLITEKTGENFNIFSILRMESSEVKTHSSFLAELLNPKGSHGQGDTFLKIFLEQFCKGFSFNSSQATVYTEYYIGEVTEDETEGGRLDIFLYDEEGNQIMIENKIYAKEQNNQLLRYHNFAPKGKLFYLTLEGELSLQKSSCENFYERISYKNDIINWLEICKKEVVDISLIKESINVYINLLKKLTNKNINKEMEMEIKDIIMSSKEYKETALKISQATNSLEQDFLKKMDKISEGSKAVKQRIEERFFTIGNKGKIDIIGRFPYDGKEIIKFDIYFNSKTNKKDIINYQLMYSHNFKINSLVFSEEEGEHYNKLLKTEKGKKIDKTSDVYIKETSSEILNKVEERLNEILTEVL